MSTVAPPADALAPRLAQIERLIAQRQLDDAEKQVAAIAGAVSNDARIHLLISRLGEAKGDHQRSIESARRAVAAAPGWGIAMAEFAMALARANRFKHALAAAERAIPMDPSNPGLVARMVDVAMRAQHLELALRWLRHLYTLAPGDRRIEHRIAQVLRQKGDHAEAIVAYGAIIESDPKDAVARLGRVQSALATGQRQLAQDDCAALLADAPDNEEFRFWDAIARGETPPRQPVAVIEALYEDFAEVYDQHVVAGLKYKLPKLVGERILRWHPDRQANVLDLGCGTGLLGAVLGRLQGALIGVDLSEAMIRQAHRHGVYDRFHRVDLHDALDATPESLYEVITALDVFIYAGDLRKAIPDAFRILKPGGRLVFSCEEAREGEPDMVLRDTRRYAHRIQAVEAMCRAAGFEAVDIETMTLRYENLQPVDGFLVVARKPA